MSHIDAQRLLAPISPESPCGVNLEYDALAMELERVAQGKPEQQFGDTIVAAEEPDWRQVQKLCLELLTRAKDLRFATRLARAVLRTDGLEEFRNCLVVIQGYLETYWDSVHPQLDPSDDNDPMLRVNIISPLADRDTTLESIERAELVTAQGIGRFCYRDVLVAEGERQPVAGQPVPDKGLIDAALMGCDLDRLQAQATALDEAIGAVRAIETALTDRVGAAQSCSLDSLLKKLREVAKVVQSGLARRGVGSVSDESPAEAGAPAAAGGGFNGAVQNRQDVIKAIDRILDYYGAHEPSSPIPLLLKGAKRMATMTFLEIVHDVTPEGLQQLKSIAGIKEESAG
jgi:type VI secretion system protein ImpA